MKLSITLLLFLIFALSSLTNAQDKWARADRETVRLPPAAFLMLPKRIISYLQLRRCTIPQAFIEQAQHNVIRGHFANRKQVDWAVLCSRNRVSAILIFWNGSTKSVSEIEKSADKHFLQEVDGNGSIAFSRSIGVVGRAYIMQHHRWYGGRKPPKISHQGIDDGFAEKASSVHYFYSGRWLTRSGAD